MLLLETVTYPLTIVRNCGILSYMSHYTTAGSRDQLCGTAAGYTALGTQHRMECSVCREASTRWFTEYQKSVAGGYREQWIKANPPTTFHA
jgi:hypothetical protein